MTIKIHTTGKKRVLLQFPIFNVTIIECQLMYAIFYAYYIDVFVTVKMRNNLSSFRMLSKTNYWAQVNYNLVSPKLPLTPNDR